ncbi:DUF4474 domain-containing protein [Alkaliphilus peptidifermentans]|uniref:DUF4474 domain-containing protein n=1 Tax=Alkaliphilus peptidifermentans DSM 18978 TaxID=1120976 RepID=A0A1G5LCX7_9FIRM|nr:DUF4474 domain-containing protein [Alkaliphilus peptidifermentans]SCZ10321.1 protein of unknown function [Alkaliphilus peptidifermentans DSM 18978]
MLILINTISNLSKFYLSPWCFVIFAFILILSVIIGAKLYRNNSNRKVKKDLEVTLDELIEMAGYSYDLEQDIFFSNMYAWQRDMGYCRLYDEAAAPLSIIIDCEPIYFEYNDKRWLIEFWKGQYGMATGCEIGVYATDEPNIDVIGLFNGPFYYCVGDDELLQMSFVLTKNGKTLFERSHKHWWLTGFLLGEFSEPSELIMNLYITLDNETMRDEFLKGVLAAGYLQEEIKINANTIGIKFDKAHTNQPFTRGKATDLITQRKNKRLCDEYHELTKEFDNSLDKIKAIQEKAPDMLDKVFCIGKSKELFKSFERIKRYLK